MWQNTSVFIQNAEGRAANFPQRAEKMAAAIKKTEVSFIAFQELYKGQLAHMDALLLPEYKRGAYRGGRVIYYRVDRWKPVGVALWKNMQAGKSKPAIGRTFERLDNKARIDLINVHLSYEISSAGQKKRRTETRNILAWAKKVFPKNRRVYVGDWNSPAGATNRPDDSGPIMNAHGYHDLGVAAKTKLGRGHYHIDRAFGSGTATRPLKIEIVNHKASDHPGVFVKFSYKTK